MLRNIKRGLKWVFEMA